MTINSLPYMNVLKDHRNKHQNMLFQFDLVKFSYLLNPVGTCIFYTFQWKPDISHLISSKPAVMKWIYCQIFSVTEWLNCNIIKVWKISIKRVYSFIEQLTRMNTPSKLLPARSNSKEIIVSFCTGKYNSTKN